MKLPRLFSSLLPLALLLTSCSEAPPETKPKPIAPAKTEPVKISHFYASVGVVSQGESVTICYGVENADEVELTPNIKAIKPGSNRCFSHTPKVSGTLKLTARGGGAEATEELVIQVKQTAPERKEQRHLITMFLASEPKVGKGQPVTLCYGIEGAETVKIDPPIAELEPTSRCFSTRITKTTTFTITATAGSRREERQVTVVAE